MHFPFTSFVSLSKYNTGFISSVVSGSIIVIGLCKFGVYFMSLYSVSCSEYNVSNLIGTGLGLSIVKSILELHKYNYGVKSEKNKGTTFYFEIIKKENI